MFWIEFNIDITLKLKFNVTDIKVKFQHVILHTSCIYPPGQIPFIFFYKYYDALGTE